MAEPPRSSGKPKPSPKPKDDKPQIERFKETARQLGVDESGEEFLRMVRKVVPPKARSN
jgi:hypothetical protein